MLQMLIVSSPKSSQQSSSKKYNVKQWCRYRVGRVGLEFGSSVNSIPTRGADYAHHITACPPELCIRILCTEADLSVFKFQSTFLSPELNFELIDQG